MALILPRIHHLRTDNLSLFQNSPTLCIDYIFQFQNHQLPSQTVKDSPLISRLPLSRHQGKMVAYKAFLLIVVATVALVSGSPFPEFEPSLSLADIETKPFEGLQTNLTETEEVMDSQWGAPFIQISSSNPAKVISYPAHQPDRLPRLIVYQQTHHVNNSPISLLPLIDSGLTHIYISAIHLNGVDNVTLNDHSPNHTRFDILWDECDQLRKSGIKVMGMLGGAARGSYDRLDGDALSVCVLEKYHEKSLISFSSNRCIKLWPIPFANTNFKESTLTLKSI
jgi:hypothetical protein